VGLTTGSLAGAPQCCGGDLPAGGKAGGGAGPWMGFGLRPHVSYQAGKGLLGDSPSLVVVKGKPSVPRR